MENDAMESPRKIAIVTGAGSGVGKVSALALLENGWSVVLAGRRAEMLEATASEAGSHSAATLIVPTDVSDPESVRTLFERTKNAFARLDLLFNNAGVSAPGKPLEDLTLEQWKKVVDI